MNIGFNYNTLSNRLKALTITGATISIISILVLLFSFAQLRKNIDIHQKASRFNEQMFMLYTMLGKSAVNNEAYKPAISEMIDNSENDFILLKNEIYSKKYLLSDSTTKKEILESKDLSGQILWFADKYFANLKQNIDEIIFKEIVVGAKENDITKYNLTLDAKQSIINSRLLTERVLKQTTRLEKHFEEKTMAFSDLFFWLIVFSLGLNIFIYLALYRAYKKETVEPILSIIKEYKDVEKRNFSSTKLANNKFNSLEYKQVQSYIHKLINIISEGAAYVKGIDFENSSNVNIKYLQSQENPLAISLLEMNEKLKDLNQKERQRNWAIEGQAIFSELLSKNHNDIVSLTDEILTKLVKYMGAVQGGFFILNEDQTSMKLISFYAYDRKKYITKTIDIGEGIVGQVWQEGKTLHIKNTPSDHAMIKSGLGESKPNHLVVIPLKDNSAIYGIIEIISFSEIEAYKVNFLEHIAENIAATLASMEVSNRTQQLLKESQELTQKMMEQEEEMLQNLEELQATQEEIKRRELQKENELKTLSARFNEKIGDYETEIKHLMEKIELLTNDLSESKEDNETIRQLKDEIANQKADFESIISDLNETIKIKDMRVEKLRKRLEK